MTEHSLVLTTTPSEQWKMLTKGYTNKLPHAINELVDNALMAFLQIAGDMQLHISITEQPVGFGFKVSDSGPAFPFQEIANNFSVGKAKRNGLNEHGMGLNNVLAFLDPTNTSWRVIVVPLGSEVAYIISAPWDSPIRCVEVPKAESGHPFPSGVSVCVDNMSDTIARFYGGTTKGRPKVDTITERLKHILGVTYAKHPLMNHPKRALTFKINGDLITPEHPADTVIRREWLEDVVLMENTPPVRVKLTHMCLRKANDGASDYYKRNMETSGAMIRIHGRLIERWSPSKLYGNNHNSFNPFLCDVELTLPYMKKTADEVDGIPPTMTTKNGLIESDPRTQALLGYIVSKIPVADAKDPTPQVGDNAEAVLSNAFKQQRDALRDALGDGYSNQENKAYPMGDGMRTNPIDFVEFFGNKITIYEFKKDDIINAEYITQIWTNYVSMKQAFPDKTIEPVLISHTSEANGLGTLVLNTLKQLDTGFQLKLKKWSDYNIGRYGV